MFTMMLCIIIVYAACIAELGLWIAEGEIKK